MIRFTLQTGESELAVYRWGEARAGRPAALLTHGTGCCGPIWQGVAEALAYEFVVYAFDRRGHGASGKPRDAYQFSDFARDVVGAVDRLQLTAAFAIGHSAGATNWLLAAAERPQAFRCVFAMEPTINVMPAPAGSSVEPEQDERVLAAASTTRIGFAESS